MRHELTHYTTILRYFTREEAPMVAGTPKMVVRIEVEVPDDESKWDINAVDLAIDKAARRFLQDLKGKRAA